MYELETCRRCWQTFSAGMMHTCPKLKERDPIEKMLDDWQNWSATKISGTERARLDYDIRQLIKEPTDA